VQLFVCTALMLGTTLAAVKPKTTILLNTVWNCPNFRGLGGLMCPFALDLSVLECVSPN
jgi:hypothetical protein